jgi:hypothetical protein
MYLYEPDPSIIRAHLVDQLAADIGAGKLAEGIAYLTSDQLTINPFADAYEIHCALPFNIKSVKERLRQMAAGKVIVKKRGVPFEPKEIENRLKLGGKEEFILVLTRIGGKECAFICTRCTTRSALST